MLCRRLLQSVASRRIITPCQSIVTCQPLGNTIRVKQHYPTKRFRNGKPVYSWKNFIYTVHSVESGPKQLKVILKTDILDVGVKGELVNLPKKVSRYLLKMDLAMYASPENIDEFVVKYSEEQTQTITGRKTMMWLMHQDILEIPLQKDMEWKLTAEVLSRNLLKHHKLYAPPEAITLPNYDITNEDVGKDEEHELGISVNQGESIPIKIKLIPGVLVQN